MPKYTPIGGFFIFFMVLVTIANGVLGLVYAADFLFVAGMLGWMALVVLATNLLRAQKIQVGVLLSVGVILMGIGMYYGGELDIAAIVSGNTGLLTMITSVGFLRLVAIPTTDSNEPSQTLPRGHRAFCQTLFSTALFGAVINISAPMLIADRIHHERSLTRLTSQSITRIFAGAASWSPFFAGTAVVLTVIPEASLFWLMVTGLPFAIVGLLLVYIEARLFYSDEVSDFVGYPLKVTSLWVPGLLALLVLITHGSIPALPILITISLSALIITGSVLVARFGFSGAFRRWQSHIVDTLPKSVNELALFLAAGVLAAGIGTLIESGLLTISIGVFDVSTAMILVGIMVLAGAMGIHPVILISAFTPVLMAVNPIPNFLALCYLFAWSMGTSASPLSGTHLVFQGRYGIASWRGAVWNWPYVGLMYVLSCGWLWVVAHYFFEMPR